MAYEKVNETFHTREWRGPETFIVNCNGVTGQQGWPDQSYTNANSWHRVPVPDVPDAARWVKLFGMFVGGVKPEGGNFMFHVDFKDPRENPSVESALDWGDIPGKLPSGQGDFYQFFSDPNEREPFGEITVPCYQGKILLRWRLMSGSPERMYNNAYGLNLWCQGYLT